jgi:hypothetical protein
LDGGLASQLFSALSLCLRETDFVGWYREDRVAGAVLIQRVSAGTADISQHVCDRITKGIAERLPAYLTEQLQLRVYQLESKPKGDRL